MSNKVLDFSAKRLERELSRGRTPIIDEYANGDPDATAAKITRIHNSLDNINKIMEGLKNGQRQGEDEQEMGKY